MAISVNPMTYVVTIPQTDLTLVEGTLYELDVNDLRSWCHDWMDDQSGGITHPKMFNHFTEYTVAGVTYARAIIFLSPYSFTFEDGQYSVRLTGANTNLFDVENDILNQNQVQVISANSAGLQTVSSGSGLSQEEHDKLMGLINGLTTAQETLLDDLHKTAKNKKVLKKTGSTWELIIYDDDDTTPIFKKEIKDKNGDDIEDLDIGVLAQELASSV